MAKYILNIYTKKTLYYIKITISEIEQFILYNQIKASLHKQFEKWCPPLPADKAIMTKSQILEEFKNGIISEILKTLK